MANIYYRPISNLILPQAYDDDDDDEILNIDLYVQLSLLRYLNEQALVNINSC